MKKHHQSFNLNVGASSILVIVVILSLICFAGLSLASANADYQLSLRLAERTAAYYEAGSAAYEALYDAEQSIQKEPSSSESSFHYSYPVNEDHELQVRASVSNDQPYEIYQWQIITTVEPDLDQSLTLFTGVTDFNQ